MIFMFWLGFIPNTYYSDRRRYKELYKRIMHHDGDCSNIAKDYEEFVKIADHMENNYKKKINDSYFLSYLYNHARNKIASSCPDILECKPLTPDEVVCDADTLFDFEDYYHKNIAQNNQESIEFHDIQKRNTRYKYPCSINVYTDYETQGYVFGIDNELKDGKCVRVVTDHSEDYDETTI